MDVSPLAPRNRILAELPRAVLDDTQPFLTRMRLVPGQVLIEAGEIPEHVFFPEQGVVSMVMTTRPEGSGVQVAMAGRDSMIGGLALLSPGSRAVSAAVTQIPGFAYRIQIETLRDLMARHAALRDVCLDGVRRLTQQIMKNAACNALDTLSERVVRWLLMAHDLIDGDELMVTHEALSDAIGVRRSGVTVVASGLQDAGLIRVNRGRITILDRAGLENAAVSQTARVRMMPRQNAACPPIETLHRPLPAPIPQFRNPR